MKKNYDDIIHLPHPVSSRHPQMSIRNRVAQFSAFAALSGYDKAVKETSILTYKQVILDKNRIEELDRKLQALKEILPEKSSVSLTYFEPDQKRKVAHIS